MATEVPVYAQQCTRAGQIAYEAIETDDHSADYIWLSERQARAWLRNAPASAAGSFQCTAARNVLEYFGA